VSEGALDKQIVRRYIQRQMSKITYCYEKELLARPTLGGEVMVDFLIASNGSVTDATATGDSAVGACTANVMKAIAFPKAAGLTRVRYPFTLRRS
jgi:hypothetical protein